MLTCLHDLFQVFEKKYPAGVKSYVVIDTETSGFQKDDVLVELGCVVVDSGEIVERRSWAIDWDSVYAPGWLDNRLEQVRGMMALKGQTYPFSAAMLREQGRPPYEVFQEFLAFLKQWSGRVPFLGFNLLGFDVPRIATAMFKSLGVYYPFRRDEVIDSMAIEKYLLQPMAGLSAKDAYEFQMTIIRTNIGSVRFNLSSHCLTKYGSALTTAEVQELTAHRAVSDAVLCHHTFLGQLASMPEQAAERQPDPRPLPG
jgi:DNA polymerase III epsilon subunit-like protein